MMGKLSAAVAVVMLTWAAGTSAAQELLSVNLVPSTNKASSSDTVTWRLSNRSERSMYVVRWDTPLLGVSRPLFEVMHDGKPVPYVGHQVHWKEADADDFIEIKPHESVSAEVDLAALYQMSSPGAYSVRMAGALSVVMAQDSKSGRIDDLGSLPVESASIELFSRGRALSDYFRAPASAATPSAASATFLGCSAAQRSQAQAGYNAVKYNDSVYSLLSRVGARYTTWFGAYDYGRWWKAYDTLYKVLQVRETGRMTFDCYCAPEYWNDAYAYVDPSVPYRIHLCSGYYEAPVTGLNSKAGTIIHEMTHFYATGNTQDYSYGTWAAKSLAISSPLHAVWNADNYQFFYENTPFQY